MDNAGGLRNGAPVRLQSVDIGNVESIRIVNHHDAKRREHAGGNQDEDEREISAVSSTPIQVLLSTAGVLGETFIDIDSAHAKGAVAANNSELPSKEVPDIQDVVRASQSTLQNVNILVNRLDRIVGAVEDQQGLGRQADLRQAAL